jgi:hypothetical protein
MSTRVVEEAAMENFWMGLSLRRCYLYPEGLSPLSTEMPRPCSAPTAIKKTGYLTSRMGTRITDIRCA